MSQKDFSQSWENNEWEGERGKRIGIGSNILASRCTQSQKSFLPLGLPTFPCLQLFPTLLSLSLSISDSPLSSLQTILCFCKSLNLNEVTLRLGKKQWGKKTHNDVRFQCENGSEREWKELNRYSYSKSTKRSKFKFITWGRARKKREGERRKKGKRDKKRNRPGRGMNVWIEHSPLFIFLFPPITHSIHLLSLCTWKMMICLPTHY